MTIKEYLEFNTEYINEECYITGNKFIGLIEGIDEDEIIVRDGNNGEIKRYEMKLISHILESGTNRRLFPVSKKNKNLNSTISASIDNPFSYDIINPKVLEYIRMVNNARVEDNPVIRECKGMLNDITEHNMNEVLAKVIIRLTSLLEERL